MLTNIDPRPLLVAGARVLAGSSRRCCRAELDGGMRSYTKHDITQVAPRPLLVAGARVLALVDQAAYVAGLILMVGCEATPSTRNFTRVPLG
jgi:hypothetical protein